MATITILSREYLPASGFSPERVKIGISGSDAALILSNPNALNIFWDNYFGTPNYIMNISSVVYQYITIPPFPNLWNITQEGSDWFVYLIVNSYTYTVFLAYMGWTSFDFPYDLPPDDPNYITLIKEADDITPVYNPVTFKFISPKYNEIGYRYLVDIKTITNNLIGRLKVVPLPDGTGYVDIQKILSNYVSSDFEKNSYVTNNCFNSYYDYKVEFGEEYLTTWDYTNVAEYVNPASEWDGYSLLNQANSSLTHTYAVGDQITVTTVTSGLTANINGLHDVVAIPANNQIVIDVPYGGTGSTISVSGSTIYSDSRKTGYSALATTVNKTVWNGVFSWKNWKEYNQTDYNISGTTGNYLMLTSIQPHFSGVTNNDKNLLNTTQEYYLNYLTDKSLSGTTFYLYVKDNLNNDYNTRINPFDGNGKIRQFRFSYTDAVNGGISPDAEWIEIRLSNNSEVPYSQIYRFYIDRRCKVENHEIYFMDKLGSFLSIPFQLKENQSIELERETFNQQKYYEDRSVLDLTEGGDTIHYMTSKKTYTLNTNWMNDAQMRLFEIMMESPYTYLKLDDDIYNCIIEDTSTEIEKYKNKALFKKTIKVHLSSQNPLNI